MVQMQQSYYGPIMYLKADFNWLAKNEDESH